MIALMQADILKRTFTTYAPIIYANILVISLTVLFYFVGRHTAMASSRLMSTFMGIFFIVYAAPKLYNLTAFVRSAKRYDIIVKKFSAYGYAYPFIELLLGVAYLLSNPMQSLLAASILNGSAVIITALNIVSVKTALRSKSNASCNCLGGAFTVPLTKYALFENGLMLVMALAMIITHQSMMGMS